jgi:hypothetical protein
MAKGRKVASRQRNVVDASSVHGFRQTADGKPRKKRNVGG